MKNINSSSFLNLIKSNLNLLFKIGGVSLLAVASQTLITPSAFAGTALTSKEVFPGKVNYTVTGGTLRSRANTDNACSLNSTSSAQLSSIPTNATIRKAYLYWSGSGLTVDSQIKLDGTSLTADKTYTDRFSSNSVNYDFFQGVKDVTSLVAAKKNGTYQFSELSVNSSSTYCNIQAVLSGWSLVVVYNDPAIPDNKLNTINLYEGFQVSRNQSVNYTLGNIKVASNPVAKFSMLLWEGDVTLGGDNEFFKFNNNLLTDAYNPAKNQFNSSINTLQSTNTYGVDLDTFDVSSFVTPNATSVTGTVSTNDDMILQGAALMMVTDQLAVQPNQAPNAVADTIATNYGAEVTVPVLANDNDPEGQGLTITNVSSTTGANVQIVGGKVLYIPKANFGIAGGSDNFTYTIRDPQGLTNSATVTVNIGRQPNRLPSAINDNISTAYKTPVIVHVLENDTDLDGNPITIANVSSTTGADVQIVTEDGIQKVQYTPNSNFGRTVQTDTFSYTIRDSEGATGLATVTVTAKLNNAPVAKNDNVSTAYGAQIIVPVLDNDTDSDGQPITITNVSSTTGANVQIVDVNGTQQVQYTPKSDFVRTGGLDTFTYTIEDVQGAPAANLATVSVQVAPVPNGAPVAVADTANTAYGAPVTVNVLANDRDPERDTISIKGATSATGATVEVVSGQVRYTPKTDFNTAGGIDTFTYTIEDDKGAESSASVTVTVAAKNASPDANNDVASTTVSNSVTIDVLANDRDAENDQLSISSVNNVTGGTAVVENNKIVYTAGSTPGTYSLNYTVMDGRSSSTGTVTITVTSTAD